MATATWFQHLFTIGGSFFQICPHHHPDDELGGDRLRRFVCEECPHLESFCLTCRDEVHAKHPQSPPPPPRVLTIGRDQNRYPYLFVVELTPADIQGVQIYTLSNKRIVYLDRPQPPKRICRGDNCYRPLSSPEDLFCCVSCKGIDFDREMEQYPIVPRRQVSAAKPEVFVNADDLPTGCTIAEGIHLYAPKKAKALYIDRPLRLAGGACRSCSRPLLPGSSAHFCCLRCKLSPPEAAPAEAGPSAPPPPPETRAPTPPPPPEAKRHRRKGVPTRTV